MADAVNAAVLVDIGAEGATDIEALALAVAIAVADLEASRVTVAAYEATVLNAAALARTEASAEALGLAEAETLAEAIALEVAAFEADVRAIDAVALILLETTSVIEIMEEGDGGGWVGLTERVRVFGVREGVSVAVLLHVPLGEGEATPVKLRRPVPLGLTVKLAAGECV